jgi:Peptidase propeptide and YPEB domain
MKNKLIAAGLVAGIIIGGTFAVGATENDDAASKKAPSTTNAVSSSQQITLEEATEIAKREATGTIEDVEKETEHGRLVYEFEFEDGPNETEVHIDAVSGEVTRVEHDSDDDRDDDLDDRDDNDDDDNDDDLNDSDDKDDNDDDSDDERI